MTGLMMLLGAFHIATGTHVSLPDPSLPQEPPEQLITRTVWDDLADCETGEWINGGEAFVEDSARWDADDGLFEGGLQFHPGTWDAYRPGSYPESASNATKQQEIMVAGRVLSEQGWNAWPRCSRLIGLR